MSVWNDPDLAGRATHGSIYLDWRSNRFLADAARFTKSQEDRGGLKMVFINGCFDNLHVGHMHLLQWAAFARVQELPFWRRRCIIVAVNHDDTVRQLKGRCIVPYEQRLFAVSAVKGVDYVVGFHEHTPASLLGALKPHTIVKGPDYADCLETIPGRKFAQYVVAAPRLFDVSTTKLVEQIQTQKRN